VTTSTVSPSRAASPRTVARRIVRAHNRDHAAYVELGAPSGYLIFDRRGRLVCWQRLVDAREHPPTAIILRRREHRLTTREVLAFLEARSGIAITDPPTAPTQPKQPIEYEPRSTQPCLSLE